MNKKKASKFDRDFDPEYVAARKDITPMMLEAAKGNMVEVARILQEDDMELDRFNRDGNSPLLMAVANQHAELTHFLLEAGADMLHKNGHAMDALDLAVMDGVRTPIARTVLRHCDYVVPDTIDGTFWQKSERALMTLQEDRVRLARSNLLGKTPNFGDIFAKETEYKAEWLKDLNFICSTVRKGVLLLDDDIGYLERDAMLTGSLEVPMDRRYVYLPYDRKCIRFSKALMLPDVYGNQMERRIVEACAAGDAMAVTGLLKARAHPNVEDARGQTALMRASRNGDPAVMRCLLLSKARVNAVNKEGYSALFLAAVGNHVQAVKILLRAQADLNARSCKGNSIFDFVQHEGHADIIQVLRQHRDTLREQAKDRKQGRSMSKGPKKGSVEAILAEDRQRAKGGMFSFFMSKR